MIPMTDDEACNLREAMAVLNDSSGQTYTTADEAFKVLHPFGEHVTVEFITETNPHMEAGEADPEDDDEAVLALSYALEQVQRSSHDARGLLRTFPHEMVVTMSDVSTIVVEAIGEEPSDYTAAGGGFTADGRHDENMETLNERFAGDEE